MENYEVSILIDASNGMTVNAASPEIAADLAYESDKAQPSLCHHCASEVTLGDCTGIIVFDVSGKEVYNDTWSYQEIKSLKAKIKELESEHEMNKS